MLFNYRRLVEVVIGRKLLPTEVVHHCNGHHNDNRIDNYYVYDSRKRHTIHHIKMGTIAMGLANCYTDEYILRYVKTRIFPLIKKSNVHELMMENNKERGGK